MEVKRCCVYSDVGLQPFGKDLPGHVVLLNTLAGGFAPACKTAETMVYFLLAKVYNLYIGASFAHALHQMVEHEFGFALAAGSRTGINGQDVHAVLL